MKNKLIRMILNELMGSTHEEVELNALGVLGLAGKGLGPAAAGVVGAPV